MNCLHNPFDYSSGNRWWNARTNEAFPNVLPRALLLEVGQPTIKSIHLHGVAPFPAPFRQALPRGASSITFAASHNSWFLSKSFYFAVSANELILCLRQFFLLQIGRGFCLFVCLFNHTYNSNGQIRPHSGGLISDKAHCFVGASTGYTLFYPNHSLQELFSGEY